MSCNNLNNHRDYQMHNNNSIGCVFAFNDLSFILLVVSVKS